MKIDVQTDVSRVVAELDAFGQRQVPFATALALTRTAQSAKKRVEEAMEKEFDRPTPYTLKALRVVPARKDNLVAEVLIKDEAPKGTPPDRYLRAEIEGGDRNLKRSERALQMTGKMPKGWAWTPAMAAPLDPYGNLRGGFVTALLSKVKGHIDSTSNETARSKKRKSKLGGRQVEYFIGKPGGGRLPLGVYARYPFAWGSAVRPVLIFTKSVHYKKRLLFWDIVRAESDKAFAEEFRKALAQALATAK